MDEVAKSLVLFAGIVALSYLLFTPGLFIFIHKHSAKPFPYLELTESQAIQYVKSARAAASGLAAGLEVTPFFRPEFQLFVGLLFAVTAYGVVWKWLPVRT